MFEFLKRYFKRRSPAPPPATVHVLFNRFFVKKNMESFQRAKLATLASLALLGAMLALLLAHELHHSCTVAVDGPDHRRYAFVETNGDLGTTLAIYAHVRVHQEHADPASPWHGHSWLRHVFDSEEAEAARLGSAAAVLYGAKLGGVERFYWWLRGLPDFIAPVCFLCAYAAWFFWYGRKWTRHDPLAEEALAHPALR